MLSNVHISFTNNPNPLLYTDIHHLAIHLSLNYDHYNTPQIVHDISYDFENCDYVKIIKHIGNALVNLDFSTPNMNDLVNQFYIILYDAINLCIPTNIINM